MDGAIAAPNASQTATTVGRPESVQEKLQYCLISTGEHLLIVASWVYDKVVELYGVARKKYYSRNRRGISGSDNRNTPFSSLRHELERRDSVEL